MTEYFFYKGSTRPFGEVPEEYEHWNDVGRVSGAPPAPALQRLIVEVRDELARQGLTQADLFEDGDDALEVNTIGNGLYLIFNDTALGRRGEHLVFQIARRHDIQIFDPRVMCALEYPESPPP